jgi:integrase
MALATVRTLDAARPKEVEYKITVDRGLHLRVAPSGLKTWHVRYVLAGRQRQLRLAKPYGTSGEGHLSLSAAREENARIQALARQGVDAQAEAQARQQAAAQRAEAERIRELTVSDLFDKWIEDGVARKDGNAELRRAFTKDVLPSIGAMPVKRITEHELRALLRKVVGRGVNRMAVRIHNDLAQMFAWAERRQPWRALLVDGNPAELVEIDKIVSSDYDLSSQRDRVLSREEIAELARVLARQKRAYDAAANRRRSPRPVLAECQLALWIILSTACRSGELLMAEWRHVDLRRGEWFIPKENVKGSRGKRQDQLVFLSPLSLRQFVLLHRLTGNTAWCFPGTQTDRHVSVKSLSKQVGDRQTCFKQRKRLKGRRNDDSLVLANGVNGEWTPHDLRRTAATMMQALGINPDVIDRCQNHVMRGSRVRRHYLHHDYADEKRAAWRQLGKHLEAILKDSRKAPTPNAKGARSPSPLGISAEFHR